MNLLDDGIGDLGDLLGVVCSLAWRAELAHPAISCNGCRLCNTRDYSQPMQVPRPVCDLRPKSCVEPDGTLVGLIEKCSPTKHFALNAVNGYLDFVSSSRDDGFAQGTLDRSAAPEGGRPFQSAGARPEFARAAASPQPSKHS